MMIFRIPYAIYVMYFSIVLTVWSGVVYVANGWELITDAD